MVEKLGEHYLLNIMSGSQRGRAAGALRCALRVIEPFYATAMVVRNRMYDANLFRARRLARPVISIGNLTAGGTGKTPMVRWLAARLRDVGKGVAVLSRGYKSLPGKLGDEQIMLDRLLNGPGLAPIVLRANPDRIWAAEQALAEHPEIAVFLLDDAFQHRRVARALDIVLLSATDPFGFGHVLPRGLLREPVSGLRRAGAVVITHADQVDETALKTIELCVRKYNAGVPIYRAIHAQTGLRSAGASSALPPDVTLEKLRGRRFFAFCGIGNPLAFVRQLESMGGTLAARRWFGDHHAYSPQDLDDLWALAKDKGAELLLTTEKDWVKVVQLPNASATGIEILRIDVELRFLDDGEDRLLEQMRMALLK